MIIFVDSRTQTHQQERINERMLFRHRAPVKDCALFHACAVQRTFYHVSNILFHRMSRQLHTQMISTATVKKLERDGNNKKGENAWEPSRDEEKERNTLCYFPLFFFLFFSVYMYIYMYIILNTTLQSRRRPNKNFD